MSESAASTVDGTAGAALPAAATWRRALLAWGLVLVAILVIYRQTALEIVTIWMRSETFTHGFLVPPITGWLIWRSREQLARLSPHVSYWGLLGVAAAGLAWVLGALATVGVLTHFALVSLLVLSVPAILGGAVARRIAFPLAFLFFAVPFGEFALPLLMEWTASFTVFGLRLSGVPVYREGLRFVIPSGSWSVIEACSGVRYLIASLCVGTLFAYLNYQSLRRRLIFVAVSFVVPVFANWLRAYMIVILGHLSGNRLAVGIDHLIYGWVFFGVVIAAMFWIGARWREDEPGGAAEPSDTLERPVASRPAAALTSLVAAALSTIVLAGIWPLLQWQIEHRLPTSPVELGTLAPVTGWPEDAPGVPEWTPRFKNPSAQLQASFGPAERRVGLYLGYYRNQNGSRKMVGSDNVLVGSTDPRWAIVGAGGRPVTLDHDTIVVRSAGLRSIDSLRLVAWQWYWVNGHLTASDFAAKAYTALSRLRGQGDDSAVIVVYTPMEQVGGSEATLQDFVSAAWPQIEHVLRQARDQR